MAVSIRIAFGLFTVVVILSVLFGVQYLVSTQMTSYHQEVIGVDWNSLPSGTQTLLLILKKGVGDAVLICGVSMAFLLWVPFRNGENWSRWALLIIGLTCFVPMLIGAVYLSRTTGASSPWWLNAVLIAFLFLGFGLSGNLNKK